jgi:hypothetical protein
MDEQVSKHVFVGCASDNVAKTRATEVITILQSAHCVPLPWWTTEAFRLGFSLLHNIQDIPHRISGAIFLATPDDRIIPQRQDSIVPGQELLIPRTNVMLELGYFMGVLGPSNVAICRYRECCLPSDLNGVTHIDMGPYKGHRRNKEIVEKRRRQIEEWAANLPYTAGLAVTQVVQGYTGRWEVFGKYSKWCGHELIELDGDRVELTGYADLWMPETGTSGHGVVHGQLTVEFKTLGIFAEFLITSRMHNVNCNRAGVLSFETEIFSHQLLHKRTSPNRASDARFKEELNRFEEELIGYPDHSWSLYPTATETRQLCGSFMLPDERTAADVRAKKTDP